MFRYPYKFIFIFLINGFLYSSLSFPLNVMASKSSQPLEKQHLVQYVYAVDIEYRTYYSLNIHNIEEPVNEVVVARVHVLMNSLIGDIDTKLDFYVRHSAENKKCLKMIEKYQNNIYNNFKARALDKTVLAQGGKEKIVFYSAAVVEIFEEKIVPECLLGSSYE